MKLTQRDRVMLTVLVIALSLFVGIWFIIRPAFKEVQASKAEYNELRSDYQKKQEQVEEAKGITDKVEAMYQEGVDLAGNFYDFSLSFDASEILYDLITENNITATSLSVSQNSKSLRAYEYAPKKVINIPIDEYGNINDDEEETVTAVSIPTQTVGCYSFNIGFTNMTRESVFAFVEALKSNSQKTLIVTNLSFNVPQADSLEGCSGTISLELYYLSPPEKPIIEK